MRYHSVISFCILLFFGCSSKKSPILGTWKNTTPPTQGNYLIRLTDSGYDCIVLDYFDGTSRYESTPKRTYYLFRNLKSDGDKYIDGITGATSDNKAKNTSSFSISSLGQDSLEVTNFTTGTAQKQTWTRIKTK